MQEIITPYDFVLLPIYLLIFYWIVRKKSKKYKELGLKRIFITAFILRMAGSVFYCLLIQYYYGYGDSFGFYQGGTVLANMIQKDITSLKYLFASGKEIVAAARAMGFGDDIPDSMPADSNAAIMKISALLSFFTFNKYMLISICFGFFSFIGIWKLFYVFYKLNKKRDIRLLAFFILYFPSLWFWGSGLLKEPVCVGALGIIIYLFYKNFIEKRFFLRDMPGLLLLLFILTIVKDYISAILLISFLALLFYKAIGIIRNKLFRMVLIVMLVFTGITTILSFDISLSGFVENFFSRVQVMQKSYQDIKTESEADGSFSFSLSKLNPSVESIIANSPGVIATCLFRPFVWESRKIIIFLASLEALFTLLITLFVIVKTKFLGFFTYIFTDAMLLFCFIFSILFALVVGYTTFNFGTLIRYKIIFLPFYFFLLIQIYSKYQRAHSRPQLS